MKTRITGKLLFHGLLKQSSVFPPRAKATGLLNCVPHVFISLFCELFPNARKSSNSNRKVKDRVDEFIERHGLERAKDFLGFCAELGKKQEYKKILNGQAVNYLFDYKIGSQLAVDAWLQDRGQARLRKEQELRDAETRIFRRYDDLKRKYQKEYRQEYIKPFHTALSPEDLKEFGHFTDKSIEERTSHMPNKMAKKIMQEHCLKCPDDSTFRLIEFYKIQFSQEILTLDEWILEYKTKEEYKEYLKAKTEYEKVETAKKEGLK